MPILLEEPNVYPDFLLDASATADVAETWASVDRRWWALYTKARQEKAVARCLYDRQVPFYLPLSRRPAVYHRRRVTVYAPVFAGYVFLYGSEEERLVALATGRLSRVLSVDDPEQLVWDLQRIQRLIASGAPLTIESLLAPGERVRVKRGPLAGLEGTVLVRRGRTRLLVVVNFLQQGASVEIDDFLLEPIDLGRRRTST